MSPSTRAVLVPRMLAAHVLAVVLVALAVGLGFWQLDAWTAQREAEAVDLTQETPVPIDDLMGPGEGFPTVALGRPATVTGTWQPEGSLVITGRSDDTEAPGEGVWGVTPVAVDGHDGAELLVVRGWATDATDLPEPPSGDADLLVRLQPSQAEQGVLDAGLGDRELPQLRIADAVQLTDAVLYGGYAVAAEPEPGLAEVEIAARPEVGATTAIQNLLYAIEWWVFGGFAAFVWWRFVRDAVLAERAADGADGTEPDPGADDGGDPEAHPATAGGRTPVG